MGIHSRMAGSPRRIVQELEVEVTMRHVIKLQVTSPLTEQFAKKEACLLVRQGIARLDPDIKLESRILNKHNY